MATAEDFLTQHRALTTAAGVAGLQDRTQLELSGADRAIFLHNFCTSDIRKLQVGAGCETFITDAKGGILGFLMVFCTPETLVLETVPGQADKLAAHLDRYIIREKVEIHDRSQQWAELLVAGPQAADLIVRAGASAVPAELYGHNQVMVRGLTVWLRRVDIAGPDSFLLSFARENLSKVKEGLLSLGGTSCDATAVEAARIESAFPLYGQDIHDRNLPQELDRDRRAISFTKGCYLGQETVARIDALGHVNKTLVGVRFSGSEVPPVGTELRAGETAAGQVTSAAFSPRLNAPLALAYVKRGHNSPGTKLRWNDCDAEVVPLPVWAQ